MANTPTHSQLVAQLKAMNAKRASAKSAENPGEQILKTEHPSGSDSASDDGTAPASVGFRFEENSSDSKSMYPAGADSDKKLKPGTEEKDPGNNKGMRVRTTGEDVPDTDLNNHNDPGNSSHPSAKEANAYLAEVGSAAKGLRDLISALNKSAEDSYVTGTTPEVAKDTTNLDASGTKKLDPNKDVIEGSESMEGGDTGGDGQKASAEQLADLRKLASAQYVVLADTIKDAAATDAESFVATVRTIMNGLAPTQKTASTNPNDLIADILVKVAEYNRVASASGLPTFDKLIGLDTPKAAAAKAPVKPTKAAKAGPKKAAAAKDPTKAVAELLRKAAEDLESGKEEKQEKEDEDRDETESAPAESGEGTDGGEEAADGEPAPEGAGDEDAEAVLAAMAGSPAAPDAGGAPAAPAAGGVDPALMAALGGGGAPAGADPAAAAGAAPAAGAPPAAGGQEQLSPEDQQLLMALLQQEGMKAGEIQAYAKIATHLQAGLSSLDKLPANEQQFFIAADGCVKRANAKLQNIKAASQLRAELGIVHNVGARRAN